jgi:hypothetical protein
MNAATTTVKRVVKGGEAQQGSSHFTDCSGKYESLTVQKRCGSKDAKRCCITHGKVFDTEKAFVEHASKGEHVTAWYCATTETKTVSDWRGESQSITCAHGLESDRPFVVE